MQVVHSYRNGKNLRQLVVSTLGRYDEERYRHIKEILIDMQQLNRFQRIISEINNPSNLPSHDFSFRRYSKKGSLRRYI
jgi:hypothetical protein